MLETVPTKNRELPRMERCHRPRAHSTGYVYPTFHEVSYRLLQGCTALLSITVCKAEKWLKI